MKAWGTPSSRQRTPLSATTEQRIFGEQACIAQLQITVQQYIESGDTRLLGELRFQLLALGWDENHIAMLDELLAMLAVVREQRDRERFAREVLERLQGAAVNVTQNTIQNASSGHQQTTHMARTTDDPPDQRVSRDTSALAAWVFGLLAFLFLSAAFFLVPDTAATHPIVRLVGSLLAGAFGFFASGSLVSKARISLGPAGRIMVRGTAGFGLFVLVFFGITAIPASPLRQFGASTITTTDRLSLSSRLAIAHRCLSAKQKSAAMISVGVYTSPAPAWGANPLLSTTVEADRSESLRRDAETLRGRDYSAAAWSARSARRSAVARS